MNTASGVLIVHSAPQAVLSHVEWAVNGVLGAPQKFRWTDQAAEPGMARCSLYWSGPRGSAARIASNLAGWQDVRFESIEDASRFSAGLHVMHTPSLGLHTVATDEAGAFVLSEHVLDRIIADCGADGRRLAAEIEKALGRPWDHELEQYRRGEEAGQVSWMTRVG